MEVLASSPPPTEAARIAAPAKLIEHLQSVGKQFEFERRSMSDSLRIIGSQNAFARHCIDNKQRAWVAANYRESVRILSEQFHDVEVDRESLVRSPGPRTQHIFDLCSEALQATGVRIKTAEELSKAARRSMFDEPFEPFPAYRTNKLSNAAKNARHVQMATHVGYLVENYEASVDLGLSYNKVCRQLQALQSPAHADELPPTLAMTRALIAQMFMQAGRNDAAMLTPRELVARRQQYFARNGVMENRRATDAAASLLAEEEQAASPVEVPSRVSRVVPPPVLAEQMPTRYTVDGQVHELWQQYGRLAASTDTCAREWLELICKIDSGDVRTSDMRKQVQGHLARALAAEYTSGPAQTQLEIEATLFVQWFTAYANQSERSAVNAYLTGAMHAAVKRGLALPFGPARHNLFYADTLQQRQTPLRDMQAIDVQLPASGECCSVALLQDSSAVVLAGENIYGNGFVMSLPVFAKVLHAANIGQGPSANAIVAETAIAMHRLVEIESKGSPIG